MTDAQLRSLAKQIADSTSFGADYFTSAATVDVRTDLLNVMKAADIAEQGASHIFDIEEGLKHASDDELARLVPMIIDAIEPDRLGKFIERWNAGPLVE